jgi:predicted dehydrogenase
MTNHAMSRRRFLQGSLAGLLLSGCSRPGVEVGLPEWFAREWQAANEEDAAKDRRPVAASDRVRVAVIGTGSRGYYLLNRARAFSRVELVAVCDVHADRAAAAAQVASPPYPIQKDFRELLARPDLDAVVIATPDHWHALIALAAMEAGKDVYCEKPLSLTIAEGQALVRVARARGRVFQVGSHQRSEDPQFRLACELVRNGRLGRLKTIRTLIGSNFVGGAFPTVPVPQGLDWDRWLGPAPQTDYVEERYRSWRGWYEYGGGKLTDWGAHHNDIAQWALDMDSSGPISVEATGEQPSGIANSYNIHPTFQVTYAYANGVKLHCTSEKNGVRFEGEDGRWIFVSRALSPFKASEARLIEEPLSRDAVRLQVATDHFGNFLDCVRSRKRPICDVAIGHRSATVCHLGVIALRTGKKLAWDPGREEFVDDDEANAWLSRSMRPPWRLEV